ncbi:MAG: ATP-binding protein [Bacteroidota bacterium]
MMKLRKGRRESRNAGNRSVNYPVKIPFYLLYLGWILVFVIIFVWSVLNARKETESLARVEVMESFTKDVILRQWATLHGGVYVEVNEQTPPNPHLNHPERDITTPSGRKLTLMNPAYITRQVHEISRSQAGIIGHITSLNPIREENFPDKWEERALKLFESGTKEFYGFDTIDGVRFYRYMAPLIVDQGCLRCHAQQGYKLGDIRGGISSSLPWKQFGEVVDRQITGYILGYGILLLLGLFGIFLMQRHIKAYLYLTHEKQRELTDRNLEINMLYDELQVSNREREKIVRVLAHDIKNPFSALLGLIKILRTGGRSDKVPDEKQLLVLLQKSADSVWKVLESLLEWVRADNPDRLFKAREFNLFELVELNAGLYEEVAGSKQIAIQIFMNRDLLMFGDEKRISSVIRNLLSNAIKFSNPGGRVEITAEKMENEILITVSDQGIGIPEEYLDDIFNPEKSILRQGTEGEISTGLGLMMSKDFVTAHGGKIWAKKNQDSGSVFCFTIPQGNSPDSQS